MTETPHDVLREDTQRLLMKLRDRVNFRPLAPWMEEAETLAQTRDPIDLDEQHLESLAHVADLIGTHAFLDQVLRPPRASLSIQFTFAAGVRLYLRQLSEEALAQLHYVLFALVDPGHLDRELVTRIFTVRDFGWSPFDAAPDQEEGEGLDSLCDLPSFAEAIA